jgi:hypothetical protein
MIDTWHPIGTAPKDGTDRTNGTEILVKVGRERFIARWNPIAKWWWSSECQLFRVPTHWQALP